jgi:MFS transporter, OPA family, glycerol-3-phosphate transporter
MPNNAQASTPSAGERDQHTLPPGQRRIAWTIWLAYGAFYFCRTNLSAAVPGMQASTSDGGLRLDEQQVGLILGALKIAYAVGQLVNGQLAERFSPRLLLAIGMLGSAALNIAFGFGTALYFLIFVWATNGYCQSLGWTPSVRVIANWVPVHRRGKVIGFVGTGYQLAGVLTFIVAGQAAQHFGWRGALFIPAGILIAAAVIVLTLLEEAPAKPQAATPSHERTARERHSVGKTLWLTLTNPALWVLGVALGLLDACRYGFLDWGPSHLLEVQQTEIGGSTLKYAVLPAGGILGAIVAGWATDRFFGSRRAPVACLLLTMLGLACLVYDRVAHASVPATIALLVVIGFCLMGPQVLLVGSAPADLARRGTSAAAAGFVNSLGYAGAALGDSLTGWSLKHYDWERTIYLWAACAFAAAFTAGLLWNVRPKSAS